MLTGSLKGSFSDQGNGTSPGVIFCTTVFMSPDCWSVAAAHWISSC
jgi:hypothetical protein